MGHGTDKRLEHAEHTQHHAHDPFDRKVAMTMTIIAAGLAGITLLSHRGHTETLRLQSEANSLHTQATDQWAFFQAKNVRSHMYSGFKSLADIIPPHEDTKGARERTVAYWLRQVERYEGPLSADGKRDEAKGELLGMQGEARALTARARQFEDASHKLHAAVNFIDIGHLAVELALVLCSVAVLTKQNKFWHAGLFMALVGAAVSGTGMVRWVTLPSLPH